jgi:hypothetical protein
VVSALVTDNNLNSKCEEEELTMALKKGNGKPEATENVVKEENVATEAPATNEAPATQDNSQIGIDSDKLVFLNPLTDPSQPDTNYEKDENGNAKKVVSGTIVGYRLQATIDLDVPDVGLGADAKSNSMSFDATKIENVKHVPAGTPFDVTKFEAGLLLSQERFNAQITGGDKPMVCAYTSVAKKGASGAVVSTGANTVPTISLRAVNKGESIRNYKSIDVLTFTTTTDPTSGLVRKNRTIVAGFEKWDPLTKVQQRVSTGGSATEPVNKRNKGAEAFLAIVGNRKAQA